MLPQPSVSVPHSVVFWFGVHESTPQPASLGPASLGDGATHWLFTQSSPLGHPPQLIGTPHVSLPMTPHFPVHVGVWQLLCELPSPTHTWPFGHGKPHAITAPEHVV